MSKIVALEGRVALRRRDTVLGLLAELGLPPVEGSFLDHGFAAGAEDDPASVAAIAAYFVAPSEADRLARLEEIVATHVEKVALARGYSAADSCCAYAAAANPYQTEALAFVAWRADCWTTLYATCQAAIPSERTVLSLLPPPPW